MDRWEDMTITLNFDPAEDQWNMSGWDVAVPRGIDFGPALNFFGEQGWEAVNLVPVSSRYVPSDGQSIGASYADVYRILLKRRKQWGETGMMFHSHETQGTRRFRISIPSGHSVNAKRM
jgi:hypothetical protein